MIETPPTLNKDNLEKEKDIQRDWKAYSTLFGGFIWMLYPGSVYITGNISPYIASYYSVTTTQTSNILLTIMVIGCFFLPLGTWMI